MIGIDISNYQRGLRIEQARATGYSWAIIKMTEGCNIADASAYDFYADAYSLGFPAGCYCFSHATTPQAAAEEAAFLLERLDGRPMPCGVFLDVEASEMLRLTDAALQAVCDTFCETVRAAGYTPGLYGSEYNLWRKIDPDALEEDVLVWVAHYGKQPDVPCDLWQSGDNGSVTGYGGPVDTNVARSDRFKTIVDRGYSGWQYAGAQDNTREELPPNPSVLVLEMVMAYNGYWGEPEGRKTPEFFAALREFVDDMEAC